MTDRRPPPPELPDAAPQGHEATEQRSLVGWLRRPGLPVAAALAATPRALLARVRTGLAQGEADDSGVRGRAMRLADQAERVLDRLDDTARVLERVAKAELALVERMLPIVDDLGALVKLTLEDARRRVLGHTADVAGPGRSAAPPDVIDVD